MNRALRRKQAKNKKTVKTFGLMEGAVGTRTKQMITPETTGLNVFQLNQLQQIMGQARLAYSHSNFAAAEQLCQQCLQIYPLYNTPLAMLGRIYFNRKKFPQAVEYLSKAVSLVPDIPERLETYALALKHAFKFDEALAVLDLQEKLQPNSPQIKNNRASIYTFISRDEDAQKIYDELMEEFPVFGKPFYNTSINHKFSEGDKYYDKFIKLADEVEAFEEDNDRQDAHFALGKFYEDLKEYEKGFSHYLKGNEIIRTKNNYNLSKALDNMEFFKSQLPKGGRWLDEENFGSETDVPIFIVGMPRSGTSLTEQILASHPEMHGAGELRALGFTSRDFFSGKREKEELLPKDSSELNEFKEHMKESSAKLEAEILSHAPDARHIIDKMPQNFHFLGYKHFMMPNAKIIHCKRNPIDTCLSNFRLVFEGKLEYSTNLEYLGKYYVAYSKLMDHWKEVLPDPFLEVQYEDVVEDIETEARKIIDFIGVEWDDACLEFYKQKRVVHTASTTQVRQPIYKGAVGRYERYGDLLKPLLEALEPVL